MCQTQARGPDLADPVVTLATLAGCPGAAMRLSVYTPNTGAHYPNSLTLTLGKHFLPTAMAVMAMLGQM